CTLESEYISHGEPRRGRGNEEVRSVAGVHRQGLEPHWPFLVGFAITGALIVKFTAAPADEDAKNSRFVQELNRRAYLGTGARLLQEVGERIPLSQEGRVGERADGHRVHAASPTEAPAPSNRRPRRGTGAPWSFAYADVDAVYKRSGTGEPAPGKELGANAGLRARHGWQRGSLEELLGGCPSSYVAKPGPIRWSYLSL
ncbi:hypothetical protein MUK42_33252, partial [Musa troglodytarum]